jgi:hypothetical protein
VSLKMQYKKIRTHVLADNAREEEMIDMEQKESCSLLFSSLLFSSLPSSSLLFPPLLFPSLLFSSLLFTSLLYSTLFFLFPLHFSPLFSTISFISCHCSPMQSREETNHRITRPPHALCERYVRTRHVHVRI